MRNPGSNGAKNRILNMNEYLFTGINSDGQKVTEHMEGNSPDAEDIELAQRVYPDIVWHTEDVMASYAKPSVVEGHVTPREYVRYRHMTEWGNFFYLVLKLYRIGLPLALTAVAWLVFRWREGIHFRILDITL